LKVFLNFCVGVVNDGNPVDGSIFKLYLVLLRTNFRIEEAKMDQSRQPFAVSV
jgi:hypothetical protein